MGWCDMDMPGHEGYLRGYVLRDEGQPERSLLRELGYPDDGTHDGHPIQIKRLAAACDCGWRSPQWMPWEPAEGGPYVVYASERDEELGRQLWVEHVEQHRRSVASDPKYAWRFKP